jgi:hypothetical protein
LVASLSPANGAGNIDPSTSSIVITFDRQMDATSFSMLHGPGGMATYPNIITASYDDTGRIFTIKVQLEPDRLFEFELNRVDGGGFKAADGTALKMTPIRFSTGAVR